MVKLNEIHTRTCLSLPTVLESYRNRDSGVVQHRTKWTATIGQWCSQQANGQCNHTGGKHYDY